MNSANSSQWDSQNEMTQELATALLSNFREQDIDSRHIGLMIDMDDDSIGGFGFSDTDSGNVHWFIDDFDAYEAIESLWEQMQRSWDSALFIADSETAQFNIDFLTKEDMLSWRESEDDYEGVLAHYKEREHQLAVGWFCGGRV